MTEAVKVPLLAPPSIVEFAGNTMFVLLLERPMLAPPVAAGPLRVTVQETLPAPTMVAGVQDNPDTVGKGERDIENV